MSLKSHFTAAHANLFHTDGSIERGPLKFSADPNNTISADVNPTDTIDNTFNPTGMG